MRQKQNHLCLRFNRIHKFSISIVIAYTLYTLIRIINIRALMKLNLMFFNIIYLIPCCERGPALNK